MKHSMRDAAVLVLGVTIAVGCGSDSVIGPPANYTLSLTPATLTIAQGATGTTNVVIGRTNFADPITLSLSDAPPGISGSFDPSSPTNASSTLTLNVVGIVEPGTYHLTVSGSATPGNRSTPLNVTVVGPPADYALSLTPATLTIAQGATGTTNVVIGRTNFADAITLSLSDAPPGISGSFDPSSPTNASSTLTLNVGGVVEPGTYHLTVSGSATPGNRSTPLNVTVNLKPASGNSAQIVAGSSTYSCSLSVSGQAYCWGLRAFDGTTTRRLVPTPVTGGITFASISAGQHLCGVTATGVAYCWGTNTYGQLGDGTTTDRLEPTPVVGGLSFASISAGILYTCGVTTTGEAYCWGYHGALGDGTNTDRIVPTRVSGGFTFVQISVGFYYSCGVTTKGEVYCWGGNAYFNYTLVPVPVAVGLTFASVSAGWTHTCGLATNGTIYCWGNNAVGQLGDGTRASRQNPIPVAGGLTFTTVSTGNDGYSCGVTTSGAAYCWGLNAYGQLGDGTTANKLVPTQVVGGLTFAAVAASAVVDGAHTCGLTTSGAVYCWGLNNDGQLGDGTTTQHLVPTLVNFP
jgi:alpha-tubulin suppressor-like RCC1 family protein